MPGRATLNYRTHPAPRTALSRGGRRGVPGSAWGVRYDPLRHAETLGVDVTTSRRVTGFGDYQNGHIRLHPDLVQVESRCTLAHEIVHHERRDDINGYCSVGWLDNRLELTVHTIAARRLIVVPELVDAILWSAHPAEIAEQLVVDTRTLYTWVRSMSRDDYDSLVRWARHRVRRPLADLRHAAALQLPTQRTGDAI